MTDTKQAPTPYDALLASYGEEAVTPAASLEGSRLTISENRTVRLLKAQQDAYLRALADLAPVIEAARELVESCTYSDMKGNPARTSLAYMTLRATLADFDKEAQR